jgi:predicted RNA-binding Zn-ribbon protein involved in translation (DUF1610 family)
MPLFQKKPECPYCGKTLDVKPTRKKKCPHCGRPIFVRQGNLRTQEQAETDDWLKRLEYLGVTRKDFDRHQQELAKQFGLKPVVNDTVWRILNSRIASTRSHQDLRLIYQEMAHLVETEGKDSKPYNVEARKHELLEIREGGFWNRATIQTANDDLVCPACRKLAKKTCSIDEALQTLPIPNLCQSERGCRCSYGIDTDSPDLDSVDPGGR